MATITPQRTNPAITPARPGVVHPSTARPGATTTPSGTPIPASAKAIVQSFLQASGLGALTDWAWNEYVKLGGGDAAMQAIQLELPQQQVFKARFPAIDAMRKAGLQPVTVSQYLDYENTLSQSLKSAGLPPQFWSPTAPHSTFNNMVTGLLSNNVSAAEANARVQQGVAYMQAAAPEVRQAFGSLYGAHGDGALTALYLDPNYTLPTLEKMQQAAFTSGIGDTVGIGGIGRTAGENVAQLGLSDSQVRQQLQQTAASGVASGRVGEQLTGSQVVQGAFGTNGQDAATLARIVQQRRASAAGLAGESFRPSTAQGVASVGVAPS